MVTPANKIDSNVVATYLALESPAIGKLPGALGADAVWFGLEPNSFEDFGGTNTLLSRNFITNTRQRTKGNLVDLEAGGGLQIDLTQRNHLDIARGFMFADYHYKGISAISAVDTGEITVADGTKFPVGSLVKATYLNDPANLTVHPVTAVAGNDLTVTGIVAEAGFSPLASLERVGITAGAGDLTIDVSGTLPALESTTLDLRTLGLITGDWVFIGGDIVGNQFANSVNNGFKRVRTVAQNSITFDKSNEEMVTDAGTGKSIQLYLGRFLKNEKGSLIKRFTYQMERQLGAADVEAPSQIQAEYLVGMLFNEMTMNVATADKITVDLTTLALNNEYRTGAEGPKIGTRVEAPGEDPFNTSTDIPIYHLAVIEPGNEAPVPLFAFVTDFSFSINNNLSVNKAIGVLGGFDVTAGTFEVSASMEAYFNDIAAAQAVKENKDVTLHTAIVGANNGIVIDFPLLGLGDGRLTVEINEAIKIPLESEAATGKKINPGLDYTLGMVFFDYLPALARTL